MRNDFWGQWLSINGEALLKFGESIWCSTSILHDSFQRSSFLGSFLGSGITKSSYRSSCCALLAGRQQQVFTASTGALLCTNLLHFSCNEWIAHCSCWLVDGWKSRCAPKHNLLSHGRYFFIGRRLLLCILFQEIRNDAK